MYSLKRGMIDWEKVFADAAVFHCSGITCAISRDSMESTMDAIKLAAADGLTIVCDINYRKNLWGYGMEPHDVIFNMMQYSDIVFGDQNEWEVASGVPHIPFVATDDKCELDKDAYQEYFQKMHKLFPKCKKLRANCILQRCTTSSLLSTLWVWAMLLWLAIFTPIRSGATTTSIVSTSPYRQVP